MSARELQVGAGLLRELQVGAGLLLDFAMMLGGALGIGVPMALAIIWVCS